MGVVATLGEEVTEVEPGGSATCSVKLFNDGTVVDSFHLDVLGDAKDWAKVSTPEVRIFPGEVETVEIEFSPPRKAEVKQGRTGYALRVMSQEDTDRSAIVEGFVEVAGYQEVELELLHRTLRGSRSARGRVAVDNLGNSPVTVRLTGADDDGKLRFRFPPPVTVAGGTTRVVSYRLVPRDRFLRGENRTHVYRIQAKGGGEKSEAAGSLVQPAMLAPWMPKALLLAVGAAIVAFLLLPTFFKADTDSWLGKFTATGSEKEADPPAASPSGSGSPDPEDKDKGKGGKGDGDAGKGGAGGQKGQDPAKGGGGGPSGGPSGGGGAPGNQPGGTEPDAPLALADGASRQLRLEANSKPGGPGHFTAKDSDPVPKGNLLTFSDLKIDNPKDDNGTIELRRDNEVLYAFSLRDAKKEWHWTQPLTFTEGQKIVLAVNCTNGAGKNCTPAVELSGRDYATDADLPALAAAAGTNFRLKAAAKPGKPGAFTPGESKTVEKDRMLTVGDLNIENLAGDSGTVELRRDGKVLHSFDLKDPKKEWHWTEPLTFTGGQKLELAVNCTNSGSKQCTPAVAFSGRTYTLTP
ncbi:hypothetical protein [Streptomyces sp. NPDC001594]|uniref:COG1470 family protein n=1 Tax=Streptomyces sp. NPDC001594 TaxID=3364590 RepID=UPI0036CA02F2